MIPSSYEAKRAAVMDKSLGDFKNNCTLIAAKYAASELSDQEVMDAFLRCGWVPGYGMRDGDWTAAIRALGLEIEGIPRRELHGEKYCLEPTLSYFCKHWTKGLYLVGVRRHLLVVHDGAIVDPNVMRTGGRRRVISAYKVLNPRLLPCNGHVTVALPYTRSHSMRMRLENLDATLKAQGPLTVEECIELGALSRSDARRWLRKGIIRLI